MSQNRPPWTADSLSIVMQGLSTPQSGYQYDAWLINNDSEQVTALGTMTGIKQSYSLHYNGTVSNQNAGPNLLSPGDKIEITLEKGTPKQPVGTIVLSSSFPPKAFAHMTHLLVGFPETPGQIGMLVGLIEQTHLLNIQADILGGIAASKASAQIHCAAQNMIDIIEGTHGANYQPLAATCLSQAILPGDGFGLLGSGFLAGTAEHATLAISQPDATNAMHQHAALLDIAVSNVKTWVTAIDRAVLNLRNNPADLSRVGEIMQLADDAFHGVDSNGDGQIDPVPGEAGALTAFLQGQLMATLTLTSNV